MYVENIADVFFPVDGGDDPVWPNAANNAFKRAAYGLIDFYLEEEAEMRALAERTGMDDKVLETKLDEMWGKVTLYNCYQLFVQLTSQKKTTPMVTFSKRVKEKGTYVGADNVERQVPNDGEEDPNYDEAVEICEKQSELWEGKSEMDLLSLYFNATDRLPRNGIRNLVANANNALKSMGTSRCVWKRCTAAWFFLFIMQRTVISKSRMMG